MLPSASLRLLEKMPLFEGIDVKDLQKMAFSARQESFCTGSEVVSYGHKTSTIYLVINGTLKIVLPTLKKSGAVETLINLAGPGDLLGEIHALDGKGHSASVVAAENVSLLAMPCSALLEVKANSPLLTSRLEALITQRLRLLTERQAWIASARVEERVGRLLLGFAERYANRIREYPDRSPDRECTSSDYSAINYLTTGHSATKHSATKHSAMERHALENTATAANPNFKSPLHRGCLKKGSTGELGGMPADLYTSVENLLTPNENLAHLSDPQRELLRHQDLTAMPLVLTSRIPVPIPLRLPQRDIAGLVGACRYRTGEALRELRKRELIAELAQYRITVLDRRQLASWCATVSQTR